LAAALRQPTRSRPVGSKNQLLNPGRWKQGLVWSEPPLFPQERNPLGNDDLDVRANREKYRRKDLAVLGAHVSCIMKDGTPVEVDMTHQHRCDRIVSSAAQDCKSDNSPVAFLYV
jgi:hypothetical protein